MVEPFIGTGIFLFLGLGIIFSGLWGMSYEKRFSSGNVSVTNGKITEICEHTSVADDGSQSVCYTASVEYWVNGELYRISGTVVVIIAFIILFMSI